MQTLELTKYQARQALNTYHYAKEDLKNKDLNYVETEAKINNRFSDIREENGVFLWVRKSKENIYVLTIDISDHTQMKLYDQIKINGESFSIEYLQGFLNDLTDEEQKEALENMYLGSIEKYASERTGIPITFKKKLYQDKKGVWNLKLHTDNLIEHAGICKAMLRSITADTWGSICYYIDNEYTGEQKLSHIMLHFSYEHIDGGTNGHEFGRIRWNEKNAEFEGYNYETERYEAI